MSDWTPQDDAILRKHVGKFSMSKIGDMLGRTKNSAIGRARRLGIGPGNRLHYRGRLLGVETVIKAPTVDDLKEEELRALLDFR